MSFERTLSPSSSAQPWDSHDNKLYLPSWRSDKRQPIALHKRSSAIAAAKHL